MILTQQQKSEGIHIVIIFAGVIGAGKTLYSKRLAETLGTKVFFESVNDNPILAKYYEDAKRYAFPLQIHFLNKRFEQIKQAFYDNDNVLDRSIYEDKVFAWANVENGNISTEEWEIYSELLDNMMEEIQGTPKKSPDLLVYLKVSFEREMANIKQRNRSYEQIEQDPALYNYYRQLHAAYADWVEAYDYSDKLIIDADQYDIHNEADWQVVYQQIQASLKRVKQRQAEEDLA